MNRTAKHIGILMALLAMLLLIAGAYAEESAAITGCAYVDADLDLVCSEGEQLMSGLPVRLYVQNGDQWQEKMAAETDAYGQYAFEGLEPGVYCVRSSTTAEGFAVFAVGDTARPVDGSSDFESEAITVTDSGSHRADIALGQAATLQVLVFEDRNSDTKVSKYDEGIKGVLVEVLDGETVVASGETAKKGDVAFTSLKPGTYTLRFTAPEGIGFAVKGDDFAKESIIGDSGSRIAQSDAFTFAAGETVKLNAGARKVGTFSGRVFEDTDNNGLMDETDPGVGGVALRLEGKKLGNVYEVVSNDDGSYFFDLLPTDSYIFTATLPEGMLYARYSKEGGDLRSVFTGETLERDYAVSPTKCQSNKNVGVIQNGTICGTAFLDIDYDGIWDEEEPGYAGVAIEVTKFFNGDSMGRVVTGEDGAFRLEGLRSSDYRMRVTLPEGSTYSCLPPEGEEGNRFTGKRYGVIDRMTVQSGSETSVLIGVAEGATIQGNLFEDANYNGVMDAGERTFSGLQVLLADAEGNTVAKTTSIARGAYTLDDIMPGTYTLKVKPSRNNGFTRLRPTEEGGSHIRELLDGYGISDPMEIAMAQHLTGVNAGMLPAATVSGILFHDLNDNGLQDAGETGLTTASVRLLSADGEIDLIRGVAENGGYLFEGVMPGDYTLTYLLPEHTEIARVAQGGNTQENAGRETVSQSFAVAMGEDVDRPLVGCVTLGSFEGTVFHDVNANGVQDDGEELLKGAKVSLSAGDEASEAVSGKDGAFSITDLRPGEYQLTLTLPEGYISSADADTLVLQPAGEQTLACPWSVLVSRRQMAVGAVKPASVSGAVHLDENNNGAVEEGERMMTGLVLTLVNEDNGDTQTITADESGFTFAAVRPGSYTVRFDMPQQAEPARMTGSTFSLDGTAMVQTGVVVTEGQQVSDLLTALVSRTSIGGTLSLSDESGLQPVAGVSLALLDSTGAEIAAATSDENGSYRFDGLWPGEYSIRADRAPDAIFVRPGDPNYPDQTSVILTDDGNSGVIALKMAEHRLDENILYIRTAKVGDLAWLDENANGLLDGSERRLPGVVVQLLQDGEPVYETTTDLFGYYQFDHVYPGAYTLQAVAYSGLTITKPVPALRIISSCLTGGDGASAQSDPFTVESGSVTNNFDLGYVLLPGQQLPALEDAPGRDWSMWNAQYSSMQE